MIHAILEDLLTPEQARGICNLIDAHLSGPDGVRLFDRPMPYHGGPQRFFQRAESATFFGREIGLMYMHAHLRYAQALAHVGEAERFFQALCQANPIGIRSDRAAAPRCARRTATTPARTRRSQIATGERGVRARRRRTSRARRRLARLFERRRHRAGVDRAPLPRLEPRSDSVSASIRSCRRHSTACASTTTLLGKPIEVSYAVGAKGCGVSKIELNGRTLSVRARAQPVS